MPCYSEAKCVLKQGIELILELKPLFSPTRGQVS